jgi:hypothetical protein
MLRYDGYISPVSGGAFGQPLDFLRIGFQYFIL